MTPKRSLADKSAAPSRIIPAASVIMLTVSALTFCATHTTDPASSAASGTSTTSPFSTRGYR